MTAVALHFDEISRLCRQAALASGYPAELAEAAGEMTLWLERHRIPGMAVLAALLEGAGAFDPARRVPETLESGELRFGEPLMAGDYLLANFDRLEFPARINGPDLGTLLIVPYLALAAHQRGQPIRISFLGKDRRTVGAQFSYHEGKSACAGEPVAIGFSSQLGVEFPARITVPLAAPRPEPVEVPAAFRDALERRTMTGA